MKSKLEMDIPVDARVQCRDGRAGRSICVVVDPVRQVVTHLVVETATFPHDERLVPIDRVQQTTADTIQLDCSRAQLDRMDPFLEHEFIRTDVPAYDYPTSQALFWPYVRWQNRTVDIVHEHVPVGEKAIHRGARVAATDQEVGAVDELLVDPDSNQITHLVLREGHLWGQKDVFVPVSVIDHMTADTIFLTVDARAIDAMPTIAVKRWWS